MNTYWLEKQQRTFFIWWVRNPGTAGSFGSGCPARLLQHVGWGCSYLQTRGEVPSSPEWLVVGFRSCSLIDGGPQVLPGCGPEASVFCHVCFPVGQLTIRQLASINVSKWEKKRGWLRRKSESFSYLTLEAIPESHWRGRDCTRKWESAEALRSCPPRCVRSKDSLRKVRGNSLLYHSLRKEKWLTTHGGITRLFSQLNECLPLGDPQHPVDNSEVLLLPLDNQWRGLGIFQTVPDHPFPKPNTVQTESKEAQSGSYRKIRE